jgi:hypothetical protein
MAIGKKIMRQPQGVLQYDADRELIVFGKRCLLVQKIEGGAYLKEYDLGVYGRESGEKYIREVSEKEIDSLALMGEGEGISFSHCLFMGWKHDDIFFERVVAFRPGNPRHSFTTTRFDFYADKPS